MMKGLRITDDDPLAQAADVGLALRADLDDGEFVAADAGDGVGLAQQRAQPLADFLDELVAGIVAERVVDLLEAVEIEHQQGDLLARAAIAGQRLGQAILEQGAVGEAGELVVQRLVLGVRLARLELVDQIDQRLVEEGHDEDDRDGRGQRDRPDRAEQLEPAVGIVLEDADGGEVRQNERRHGGRYNRRADFARISQEFSSPPGGGGNTSLPVNKLRILHGRFAA